MGINSVAISGNLTRDPEVRTTAGGTAVMRMCVAVGERHRNPQTGEWEDRANYIDCVMFGPRGEALGGILRKGRKVAVQGRLRQSQWEDERGRHSKVEVVAEDVDIMSQDGSFREGGQTREGSYADRLEAARAAAEAEMADEDIPF